MFRWTSCHGSLQCCSTIGFSFFLRSFFMLYRVSHETRRIEIPLVLTFSKCGLPFCAFNISRTGDMKNFVQILTILDLFIKSGIWTKFLISPVIWQRKKDRPHFGNARIGYCFQNPRCKRRLTTECHK